MEFIKATRYFYYPSLLLGVTPFIIFKSSDNINIKNNQIYNYLGKLCLIFLNILINFSLFSRDLKNLNQLVLLISDIIYEISLITSFISMIIYKENLKKIYLICLKFYDNNKSIRKYSNLINKFIIINIIWFCFSSNFFYIILPFIANKTLSIYLLNEWYFWVPYLFIQIYEFFFYFHFHLFLYILYFFFKTFNEDLLQYNFNINQYSIVHNICSLLQEVYEKKLLIMFSLHLWWIVYVLFLFFTRIIYNSEDKIFGRIRSILYLFYELQHVLIVCYLCEKIKKQVITYTNE